MFVESIETESMRGVMNTPSPSQRERTELSPTRSCDSYFDVCVV